MRVLKNKLTHNNLYKKLSLHLQNHWGLLATSNMLYAVIANILREKNNLKVTHSPSSGDSTKKNSSSVIEIKFYLLAPGIILWQPVFA
jgi:hypothetical protein